MPEMRVELKHIVPRNSSVKKEEKKNIRIIRSPKRRRKKTKQIKTRNETEQTEPQTNKKPKKNINK